VKKKKRKNNVEEGEVVRGRERRRKEIERGGRDERRLKERSCRDR
jgi:hypothetical protein